MFEWSHPSESKAVHLPTPLAELTVEDVLDRVQRRFEPDDHCDALVLVHEFVDLMRSWYAAWPEMPAVVCRSALQGLIDNRPPSLMEHGQEQATVMAIVAIGQLWKLTAKLVVGGRKPELPSAVSQLLLEIFAESEILAAGQVS